MIRFLVTIDTEEEREWGSAYEDHSQYTVENIKYLPALQEVFNKHGVVATYLIDYPVAVNEAAMQILNGFRRGQNAEIGTHLHPWVNPPYEEERTVANSFTHNLPPELQYKKMKMLTEAIAQSTGEQPKTYRAGRYGFDESTVPVLLELGYTVDTSVVPFRQAKMKFEPGFGYLPSIEPYFLDEKNVRQAGKSKLYEVPLTVGFNRPIAKWLAARYTSLPNIGARRLLKKAFGLDLYWLRPSYANLRQMIELSEQQIRNGATVLNMMFHSNELMPMGSKYNKTNEDVQRYLDRLDKYFSYMNEHHSINYLALQAMYPKQ